MTGKFTPAALGFVALLPNVGYSLGLGNITVYSGLNQPLRAEIEIYSEDDKEVNSLNARLGGVAEFQRAGLERPFVLSRLRFEVMRRANGRSIIAVRSSEPIREPFVNFLVEINSSAGRLLREYAILLDPPRFVPRNSTPPPEQVEKSRPAPARPEAPLERAVIRTDQYGPVRRDESLWKIAGLVRPDPSLSDKQVMMALFNANPGDFKDNNINYLKRGSILRIPSAAQMRALSHNEALAEFQRHQKAWRERRITPAALPPANPPQALPGTPAPLPAASPPAPVAGTTAPEVRLLTPNQAPGTSPPASSPNAAGTPPSATTPTAGTTPDPNLVAALRQQIDLAQEISHTNQKENEELRTRLLALEEKIAGLQNDIRIKEENLAALQNQNRLAPPPEVAPPKPVPAPPPPKITPPAPPPVKKPPTPPPIRPAESSFLDSLFADPMFLALAGGLIISTALLAVLLIRRRRTTLIPIEELGEEPEAENNLTVDDDLIAALDAPPQAHPAPKAQPSEPKPQPLALEMELTLTSNPPPTVPPVTLAKAPKPPSPAPEAQFAATMIFDKPTPAPVVEKPLPAPSNNFVPPPPPMASNIDDTGTVEFDLGDFDDEEDDLLAPVTQSAPKLSTPRVSIPPAIPTKPVLMAREAANPPPSLKKPPPAPPPPITTPSTEMIDDEDFLADLNFTPLPVTTEKASNAKKEALDQKKISEAMQFDLVDTPLPTPKEKVAPLPDFDQSVILDLSEETPAPLDEVDTNLDLAKVYLDIGEYDGAREILQEALSEGNQQQQRRAKEYLAQIPKK